MLTKTYVKSRKIWKVCFKLPKEECPDVEKVASVHLVGDFNNWDQQATPMTYSRSVYSTTLEFAPEQEHQFRYLVNGKIWCNDWHADSYVVNEVGGENCVLHLPPMV